MDISDEDFENMTDEDRMIYYNAKFQKMDRLTGGALTQTTPFTVEEIRNTTGYQRAYRIGNALMEFRDWMKTNFPTKGEN